jgi:protein arginine kinase activator
MLCEICQKNSAIKKIQFTSGHTIKELNVCITCAEKQDLHSPFSGLPDALAGTMFSELVKSLAPEAANEDQSLRCAFCGTTMSRFRQTGTFGCPNCYNSFKDVVVNILIQIHGSSKHIGSRPARQRRVLEECDLDTLKAQLKVEIQRENYEKAAELRDLIRDVESTPVMKK